MLIQLNLASEEIHTNKVRFVWSVSRFLIGLAFALSPALVDAADHASSEKVRFPRSDGAQYPVTSSGYEGYSLQGTVAWIDDHRVVFQSAGPLLASGEPRRAGRKDLFVWDTRSDRIALHAQSVSGFCYASGLLRYWGGTQDGYIVEHAGRFGEEQKRVYAVDDFPPRRGWRLNSLTCHRYRREEQPTAEGVFFYPLKEGDGHFGGGMAAGSNFTVFLRHGEEAYRRLPVPVRIAIVGYSELARAYVLREAPPMRVKDRHNPLRFWLFRAEAFSLEPIVIPAGPWLKGYISFVAPTQTGTAFASSTTGMPDRNGRPTTGAGGIYLLANDRVERVMAGYPYSVSITSNGCKVVVSMTSRFMAGERATVKFVDLCAKAR